MFREVTNEPEYQIDKMARLDYEMPEKDREGTQLAVRRASFSSLNQQPVQTAKQRNNTVEEEKVDPNNQSPTKSKVQILDSSIVGDKGLDSEEDDKKKPDLKMSTETPLEFIKPSQVSTTSSNQTDN